MMPARSACNIEATLTNKARMYVKTKDKVKKSWAGADVALNVRDAPEAQVGRVAPPALACPFGTSQTPRKGIRASRNGAAES